MRFENKKVVITGGSGGIGQALVELFASEGAHVLFSDRSEEDCGDLVEYLQRKGLEASYLAGDLRRKSYCEGLIAHAVAKLGGVDILLNNAGIIPRGNILETTDDMWFGALDVNLNAVFFLCRAAIPHMQQAGGGAIVNTASTWGLYPGPDHVAYCTSKAALAALTRSLGRDHAPDGIRVNALAPGWVLTDKQLEKWATPEALSAHLERQCLKDHLKPQDIVGAILFLASKTSRMMTGQTMAVDGGVVVSG